MKSIKYIVLLIAIISFVVAVCVRFFLPQQVLFGLAPLTYLRITITMLLFAITFHFLFQQNP